MRKTVLLSMLFAATTFVLFLSHPSPSQELDAGPVDVELFDAGDEDAGDDEMDSGFDEDAGYGDLIDAGFDPFVDAGPAPIPLPEDDDDIAPPDDFAPPVQPELDIY